MSSITTNDFSVSLMTWGTKTPTPDELVQASRAADRLGYYAVGLSWVTTLPGGDALGEGEGIARGWPLITANDPGHYVDSLVVVPMIAEATNRIRLGFNAFVVPALHPFYVAKYLSTLDSACDGRLTTVFGFGAAEPDGTSRMLEWLGSSIPAKRRGDAAEEALGLIKRLWTETDTIDHQGEFFSGREMLVEPKPVQKPLPEIWWAGERKRSLRLAAQHATHLELQGEALAWGDQQPLARIREHYAPGLAAANAEWNGSAKLAVQLAPRVTDKPLSRAERAKLYWFEDRPGTGFHDVLPVGSPEQCAEVVSRVLEAGADHIILDISHYGYESLSFAMEQLDAWANQVVPLLGDRPRS